MSAPSVTKRNWHALQSLALKYLKELHTRNPDISIEKILEQHDLPKTTLFLKIAAKAGFAINTNVAPAEVCAVAGMVLNGVWSETTVSSELGLPLETVRAIFESHGKGFGNSAYGESPYSGNRKYSNGNTAVRRRVSDVGQLSYRGCLYTLGAHYRGRYALVQERDGQLLITFKDRAPLNLARKRSSSIKTS